MHEEEVEVLVKHRLHLHHHSDHVFVHRKDLIVGKDAFQDAVVAQPRSESKIKLPRVTRVLDISEFAIGSSIEITDWCQIVVASVVVLYLGLFDETGIIYF